MLSCFIILMPSALVTCSFLRMTIKHLSMSVLLSVAFRSILNRTVTKLYAQGQNVTESIACCHTLRMAGSQNSGAFTLQRSLRNMELLLTGKKMKGKLNYTGRWYVPSGCHTWTVLFSCQSELLCLCSHSRHHVNCWVHASSL